MSEPFPVSPSDSPSESISCPPPVERAPEPQVDPRAELLQMAATLAQTRSQRLLIEYLRLRRAIR